MSPDIWAMSTQLFRSSTICIDANVFRVRSKCGESMAVGSGAYVRLPHPDTIGDTIGLWLMTISLTVATTAAVITTRRYFGKRNA